MAKKAAVGGQAVIEGVMMRNKDKVAIATRAGNGRIKVKTEKFKSLAKKYPFLKLPFFRGVLNLIEMLVMGINALTYSANQLAGEEDEELSTLQIVLTISIAVLITIAVFIVLPLFLTKLITSNRSILFNVIDGLIRIVLFIGYIWGISLMKDIKRVFQYHGAEHKAVNCYEAGEKLTPKNCRKFTTAHRRCGTTFLILVLIISILIFSLITSPQWYIKLIGRILLLPVIIGVSYEVLKLGAKYEKNIILRIISAPGLWLQKLTTKQPDDKQVEVAIKSLKKVL